MDFAGVEAGEKILVPWPGEPLAATADSVLAEQDSRRRTIFQPPNKLDFRLRDNIYPLLPFKLCSYCSGIRCPTLLAGEMPMQPSFLSA